MTKMPKTPGPFDLTDCFLAGGALLSYATKNDVADYDIYPKSREGLMNVMATIMDNNCFLISISDRALTFKCNDLLDSEGDRAIIQVITYADFATAQEIFNNFDFTVCMAAYDFDTKEYTFHNDFYPDIASKTLRFNPNTQFPLNSILRTSKYRHKGFHISKPEHVKIALTIAKKGLPESWESLEEEIGGTYGKEISLAREGLDWSFENAIEVLSNIVFEDNMINLEEVWSKVELESLEAFYSNETVKYFVFEGQFERYAVLLDGKLFRYSRKLVERFGIPPHFELLPEDYKLQGKRNMAIKSKDDPIRWQDPNNYQQTVGIGDIVNSPYAQRISSPDPMNKDYVSVEIELKDIVGVNRGGWNAKRFKILG